MAALSSERETSRRPGMAVVFPVLAGALIYGGGLVAVDADGFAQPAANTAGLVIVGVADATVDNTDGDDGDLEVTARCGAQFKLDTTTLTSEDAGRMAYVVNDQTVGRLSAASNAIPVGRVVEADGAIAWIEIKAPVRQGPQQFLVRIAGTNAGALNLGAFAATLGGTDIYVRSVNFMLAVETSSNNPASPLQKVLTTHYTVSSGVISTVGNESANTLLIALTGELV